jgi:hypothetical protein
MLVVLAVIVAEVAEMAAVVVEIGRNNEVII